MALQDDAQGLESRSGEAVQMRGRSEFEERSKGLLGWKDVCRQARSKRGSQPEVQIERKGFCCLNIQSFTRTSRPNRDEVADFLQIGLAGLLAGVVREREGLGFIAGQM